MAKLDLQLVNADTSTMTKAEKVRKLEGAYACEDYFPGVLGNPVTFAARWGLPLSKGYLQHKERQLRAAKRNHRASVGKRNSLTGPRRRAVTK